MIVFIYWLQVKIGERHEVERGTAISMCRQLQQSASMSDDELEYAAASSPPDGAFNGGSSGEADVAASKQHEAPAADGGGETACHQH